MALLGILSLVGIACLVRLRPILLRTLAVDSAFDSIRSNPRYPDLRRRIHYPGGLVMPAEVERKLAAIPVRSPPQ